ncbi:hypothetical protein K2173_010382 [Erythroxylum novogranatense]|uniref:beta-ketoacyl-[acyl-carrier-protein] synthase I n=1 Tax=Erythroxylum novogranatense TaxID=1862640 RepID=A0AAV8TDG6_9ROSI|nr:hypothetical protein K2173_010382 [Erythroxylum novogranatense]
MSSIVSTYSSSVLFRSRETVEACFAPYNGLRSVENMQMSQPGTKANIFISVSEFSTPKCRKIRGMASPTLSAPRHEKHANKRVVITGMGLVLVFGSDIDTYYNKLLEGESGISLIDRFDTSTFSVGYCLVARKKTLDDANLGTEVLEKMDKTKVRVLLGTGMGGLTAFGNGVEALMYNIYGPMFVDIPVSMIDFGYKKITPFFIPYLITNTESEIGLMGPNYSISTACAMENYCFYAVANHVRYHGVGGFIAFRALSQRNDEPKRASRPWDKDGDSFVIREGAGVLPKTNKKDVNLVSLLAGVSFVLINLIKFGWLNRSIRIIVKNSVCFGVFNTKGMDLFH